jgi:glycerol-3-phosphate dehydrogenase
MKDKSFFDRTRFVRQIEEDPSGWDIIVIGGGATGLGTALDAASRGFKTLLLEQADFAKGTSSRSTKLVHGGVRYLAQGNIGLVYEALFERGVMFKNAPHLVTPQSFVIPGYRWWDKLIYGIGLKIYDLMAGKLWPYKTSLLSRAEVEKLLPNIVKKGLTGGIMYYDGQFDDARLAINIAQTCAEQGGTLLNYMKVHGLLKDKSGKVNGVKVQDQETGTQYLLHAKAVINATGVFVDEVLQMDVPAQKALVRSSQGVHLVLDKSFLEGETALLIPKTVDGRILFAVPWHGQVVVGTTDTPLESHNLEPRALEGEISFILETLNYYLIKKPARADVLSVFAGLRPLAVPKKQKSSTKEISRGHKLITSKSGLITITGGKWTTYRKMAEDTVNEAIKTTNLDKRPCVTVGLKIHGHVIGKRDSDHLHLYGSDAVLIRESLAMRPELSQMLHKDLPHIKAEVVWAVKYEMARTIEDVLARRMRVLFLNARLAIDMAPGIASIMADELGLDEAWQQEQIRKFISLANRYLLEPYVPGTAQLTNTQNILPKE